MIEKTEITPGMVIMRVSGIRRKPGLRSFDAVIRCALHGGWPDPSTRLADPSYNY